MNAVPDYLSQAVDLAGALDSGHTGALLEAFKRAHRAGFRGRQACLSAFSMYCALRDGIAPPGLQVAGEFTRATVLLEQLMYEFHQESNQ